MAMAQRRGEGGETLAAAYLRLLGFRIEATRVQLAGVEVDLVAEDGDTRVLVEVKLRTRTDYGGAAAAVDRTKRDRLRRAALALQQRSPGAVRVDVVAIDLGEDEARIHHVRNAVTEG